MLFWEYAGKGKLVPDDVTVRVWKQFITGMEMVNQFHPESEILILDGIPRNVGQARLLERHHRRREAIIHLQCADLSEDGRAPPPSRLARKSLR